MGKRKRGPTKNASRQSERPAFKQVKRTLDRNSNLFQGVPTIILIVGAEKIPFHVHMDILCRASSFFESAFMGPGHFKETSEKSMTLPDDDAGAFERLIQWLYFKNLLVDEEAAEASSDEAQDQVYWQLARLYVTADKYDIIDLKNKTINEFYKLKHKHYFGTPDYEVIDYVYENTAPNSQLRRLLAEGYNWNVHLDWYNSSKAKAFLLERPPDFAVDIAISMARRIDGEKDPWTTGSIRFHETAVDKNTKSAGCSGKRGKARNTDDTSGSDSNESERDESEDSSTA